MPSSLWVCLNQRLKNDNYFMALTKILKPVLQSWPILQSQSVDRKNVPIRLLKILFQVKNFVRIECKPSMIQNNLHFCFKFEIMFFIENVNPFQIQAKFITIQIRKNYSNPVRLKPSRWARNGSG